MIHDGLRDGTIDQIVRLTCRQSVPIAHLCGRLGLSKKQVREHIKTAIRQGFRVQIADGFVTSKVALGAVEPVVLGKATVGRYHVAHATDFHFGSRHCEEKKLVEFLREAWARGCRVAMCTGDILDGNKSALLPDQDYVGFDHQAARAVQTIQRAPPFKWVAIDGNHDGYFSASGGFVSGQVLESRMRAAGIDWTFAGVCLGRAVIHGARWQLWHPHGGTGTRNGVRRILNARAESLVEPCDVLAIGHFHKFADVHAYPEEVFCIAGGTFQRKESEFANRITREWDIGASIVSYTVDSRGRASEFSARFIGAQCERRCA